MTGTQPHLFWAKHAWVDGRFQEGVVLEAALASQNEAVWQRISTGIHTPPAHAKILDGYVLPGMVNAHSHAFQRAFAGMTEHSQAPSNAASGVPYEQDNFWSWRDRMYQVALTISPAQLEVVATKLYREMLQGGYTQVCEFHYLHHAPDGAPYPDPLEMAWALVRAAKTAGIGLTLLPVLYERAGFDAPNLRNDQRRFASTADSVWQMHTAIAAAARSDGIASLVNAGIAIHSLRAASMTSIQALTALAGNTDIPIHIHISEQTGEVDDCIKSTGLRPIDYLTSQIALDTRWQLVHATHANQAEIDAVGKSGAGLVMCPTTEANLGDGITDMPSWLNAGVPLSIGSDSHVSRDWREELRWLEYGQRLQLRQRNVLASQSATSTASRLFNAAVQGGARAAGFSTWGLTVGARADAVVLDPAVALNPLAAYQADLPPPHVLDAYVFACDKSAVRNVLVAGQSLDIFSTRKTL